MTVKEMRRLWKAYDVLKLELFEYPRVSREEIRENLLGIKYYNPNVILGNVKHIVDFMCLRGLLIKS